jgi:hypothetical protein
MSYTTLRELRQSEYFEQQDEAYFEQAISEATDLAQALRERGYADGCARCIPQQPEEADYWEGYAHGERGYWLKQKGKTLVCEF